VTETRTCATCRHSFAFARPTPKPGCGRPKLPRLCTNCQRLDDARRNAKRRRSGRTTARWQRLRLAVFARDGYACRLCGRTGTRYTLTAHLRPELAGNHWTATLDDVVTLCGSCHASVDAARAHGFLGQAPGLPAARFREGDSRFQVA
jgi:5-methylcytosine-specific restriction endonuclease McrA